MQLHIEKMCKCLTKNNYVQTQEFATKEEALKAAHELLQDADENFCHKHEFGLTQSDEGIVVTVTP